MCPTNPPAITPARAPIKACSPACRPPDAAPARAPKAPPIKAPVPVLSGVPFGATHPVVSTSATDATATPIVLCIIFMLFSLSFLNSCSVRSVAGRPATSHALQKSKINTMAYCFFCNVPGLDAGVEGLYNLFTDAGVAGRCPPGLPGCSCPDSSGLPTCCPTRCTFSRSPVSYTHLDVYKRQIKRACAANSRCRSGSG